jgi:hypothetical protein
MKVPRRALLFASVLVFTALLVVVLFVPPPKRVLRWLIVTSAPFLLDEGQSTVMRSAKELVRVYTNVGTCYYLAQRVLKDPASDEEILGRMIEQSRAIIVSPRAAADIRHDTVEWPALISGVGYCDQINAVVCRMATHHFPKAELVALYTPKEVSPHTIGRVWSEEKQQWLYFDAFFAKPVVFTRDDSGKAHFLAVNAGTTEEARFPATPGLYDLGGWTLSGFPSTFGMYLWARVWNRDDGSPQPPATPDPGTNAAAPTVAASPAAAGDGGILTARPADVVIHPVAAQHGLRNAPVFSSVVRQYAAARVKHLFGTPDRNAYRAIARQARTAGADDRAAELTSIAGRLARN